MSTDVPEGNEPQRGGSARPPRVGDSRSPVGSTLSIVLAVIAVVVVVGQLPDDEEAGDHGDHRQHDAEGGADR